ncbi:MAG: phenylacetic acid degradation protein [Rubrivivax sp. SCN 70-15]|nr:MAG: phenylacetic acid degradation protein [Rubrivivax sp. SCN 70-15]
MREGPAHGPFQDLVGYELLSGDQGACFRLALRREHLNPNGVVHGGVLMTLLDAAGGRCLVGLALPGSGEKVQSSVTVSLTSEFALAVRSGTLYAIATPDHVGKLLAYVSIRVCLDAIDGPLVARGVATFRLYTRSLAAPTGSP